VTALILSSDGKILVSGSADKTVKIWFLESKSDPYTAFSTSIWDKMGTVSKVG
jgi:WD40 repeat protein